MNVPKKCTKSEKCLRIFNTARALAYASMPMALWYRSQPGLKRALHLATHQRFLCSNEKIFASIQSLQLKYSIILNLDILRKLDFCKWNQSITTQNQKTLGAFQVKRAHSQAVMHKDTRIELPRLKCPLYLTNPPKISILKWKYHCIHQKSKTKIFNTSKSKYLEETRFLKVKLIT
jgi:hypothetical protein